MSERVIFGAVGDVALSRHTSEMQIANGMDWALAKLKSQLEKADLLFGNMESVFIPSDFPEDQIDPAGLIARLPAKPCAEALKAAGFDFMNLAANHVLDAGSIGMDYTRTVLEEAGIGTGGVGYSQEEARRLEIIERQGITFGFLCYCEDCNYTLGHTNPGPAYYTLDAVTEDVERHRDEVDILVVSIHADLEFIPTPSPHRLQTSRAIAGAGADIILQHHPHVPQGVEIVNGCLIAYSLGNCVFNAHTSQYMKSNGPHTAHSFLLLVEVDRSGVKSFERVPFEIRQPPEERPIPLGGMAREDMLAYFAELDEHLKNETFVQNTWRQKSLTLLQSRIGNARNYDTEHLLGDLICRLGSVAENWRWMETIIQMANERWELQKAEVCTYQRPHAILQQRLAAGSTQSRKGDRN